MAEHRIEIIIDHDGKINAETEGIKGEMCLDKLQELLGTLDDMESISKTDEFYQKEILRNTIQQTIRGR
jgi:hypothetical protein